MFGPAVRTLPGSLTVHIGGPAPSFGLQLPANVLLRRQQGLAQVYGSLQAVSGSGLDSKLWPNLCGHLQSELADGRFSL